jgi:hypothetical protein
MRKASQMPTRYISRKKGWFIMTTKDTGTMPGDDEHEYFTLFHHEVADQLGYKQTPGYASWDKVEPTAPVQVVERIVSFINARETAMRAEWEIAADLVINRMQSELEANSYPWKHIQRHAVISVPIVNLDADPSGNTVEYDDYYTLPKKWVDKMAAQSQSGKEDRESPIS